MVAPETLKQTEIIAVQEGLAEVTATPEVLDQMAVLVVQEVPEWTEEDLAAPVVPVQVEEDSVLDQGEDSAVDQEEVAAEEVYHGEEDKV